MKYDKQAIVQKLNWSGNAKRTDFSVRMTLELNFPTDLIRKIKVEEG